ncbi:hypothetical membrane protein [Micromonospora phaseoli]|uniref:Hypothetical membrane protein n=1 Tax=Micromonospora phaseoli TaxID=1144548 RepID=A0A1H7AWV9_9ACTN|nr:DUF998 domain-containing protein [Micromonospora phaseoli]PZV96207.1 putative membrane protein [Micromonospora phaseoli]GIJ79483.1 hypothetical protein Xph01_39150 [Micromonospora phaseoli]SEJ68407.1 hypothetical membrane protein [Micromonospora phaseoli]
MPAYRLGSYALLLAAPLFVAGNAVTALGWRQPPFSWRTHNISDLGNVTCGMWDTSRPRPVCSPWHPLMNGTMIATGLLIVVGLLLTWTALGRGAAVRAAQLAALAGASGYVLAGVYPADVDENRHFLAALLVFGAGNIALLLSALPRRSAVLGPVRWLGLVLGLTGVLATLLFFAQVDLGFGVGGMERVVVAPFLLWTVVLGSQLGPGPGCPVPSA